MNEDGYTIDRLAGGKEASIPEQIYKALRYDISFGRLLPRERLIESDLKERFNCSNHHIRTVFDQLDRAGFVVRRANRGVVVKSYTDKEVQNLYEIREILQREAALRIRLPVDGDLLDQIEAVNTAYERHGKAGELNLAAEANDQFHRLVFSGCDNEEITSLIEKFWVQSSAIHARAMLDVMLAETSRNDHRHIIQALKNADRDELVRLCVDHMKPALQAYRETRI